jgi:hypothetical protein
LVDSSLLRFLFRLALFAWFFLKYPSVVHGDWASSAKRPRSACSPEISVFQVIFSSPSCRPFLVWVNPVPVVFCVGRRSVLELKQRIIYCSFVVLGGIATDGTVMIMVFILWVFDRASDICCCVWPW